MKNILIIISFLVLTVHAGLAQKSRHTLKIKETDSVKFVFYPNPIVRINFNEPQALGAFNYYATKTAITIIRDIFLQNNFSLIENIESDIDSVRIIKNSEFAEKLIVHKEKKTVMPDELSAIADSYNERYICFIVQYGYFTSKDLERIIISANNRSELIANTYNGLNNYEYFFVSISLMNLIVWDNLKDEIFLDIQDSRLYKINVDIYQKQSIEWQFKKLIRKLNHSI